MPYKALTAESASCPGCEFCLSQEKILKTLENFGLKRPDAQIYIFLGKKGPQRARDIAKSLRVPRQTLYRAIKNLQSKGMITATISRPAKFSAVQFERILDLFAKAKAEEVHRIEQDKKNLLSDWRSIAITEVADQSPKFSVIEGRNFIYPRLKQMVEETKSQLSIVFTISGLMQADQFGLLDAAFSHKAISKAKFRLLTELSKEKNLAIKMLLRRKPKESSFEARTPELGLSMISQMLIRDDEEVAFFVSQESDKTGANENDLCLWTNSKTIVNSFKTVFEDLWHNSTDIQNKIAEIETGKPIPKTYIVANAEIANKKYDEKISSASRQIIILTSSQGLVDLSEQDQLLADWTRKQINVQIMAPITRSNLNALQKLSCCSQMKHVPVGYLGTTIVDSTDLFQFKNPPSTNEKQGHSFENTFYSNDPEYVEKTKKMLDDIWRNAQSPTATTLEQPTERYNNNEDILPENSPTRKVIGVQVTDVKKLTEEEVLSKIFHGKKLHVKEIEKDADRIYAIAGSAVIHPPRSFNLPDLMLEIAHIESSSSHGIGEVLTIYQWFSLEGKVGYAPVAVLMTNAEAFPSMKLLHAMDPAAGNVHLVREDELQIRTRGNTMFTGWTVPIPLFPKEYVLPPACLMIEGYGKVNPVGYTTLTTSGLMLTKSTVEANYFNAFVTFIHPRSKYSGPGTDGFFSRDYIATIYPPKPVQQRT
jgi:sugar-specific transcriptional regulator TrmB